MAVWRDHADAKPYVFDRRIYTHTDLGHALLRLEILLGVNRAQFTSGSSLLSDAVTLALAAPPDATDWPLATHGAIAVALDFDSADISDPTFLLADDDHGGDLDSEDECHNNSFTTGTDGDYEFMPTELLTLDDLAIELTYGAGCCGTSDCCDDNSQCGPNEHCVDGECLPDECADDSDCDPDEHCAGGTCVPDECDEINECPDGSHCEGGECVDNPCDDPGDCPSGQECIGGECEVECNGDGDCPSGDECVGGVCEDCPGQCCNNDDCDDGNPCMADECRQGRCKHKCVAPCIRCQTGGGGVPYPGFCLDCACNLSLCDLSIQATPDPACAGGMVDLVVFVNCNPDCEAMTWMVVAQPGWAVIDWPDGNGGELNCDEAPQQHPLRAQLACDAPETVEFIVYGETTLGTTCEEQCTIAVTQCVDLDVDSNNDNTIDPNNEPQGTDDPIEDELFSPATPGKWLWRNNDDSDSPPNTKMDNGGMEGSETDAGIINGTNDLVDLPELIIRPIPSGGFPTGSKLFLQTSDANSIRVFGCRTPTCAQVILGPGITQKVEIPFNTQQRTFAVEGVQDGVTLTLSLIVEDVNGFTVCSDTVRVTVIKLTAEWRRPNPLPDGTPITETNDHPSGTIGKKVFPDATTPGGAWDDHVNIHVVTIPPVQDVTVYLRAFDPDDPSADADVVDDDLLGGDNDTTQGYSNDHGETDSSGILRKDFVVAKQPGDNHRVAATMKQTALAILNNNSIPPSAQSGQEGDEKNDAQVELFIGRLTPLLTVWRKLHVETDTMVRPTFAQNTFVMPWSNPRAGPTANQVWVDVDESGLTVDVKNEQFTNGLIRLDLMGGTHIATGKVQEYRFDDDALDQVLLRVVDCPFGGQGLDCLGEITSGQAILSDDELTDRAVFDVGAWGCDDVYAAGGAALVAPDLSLLEDRYHPAYIHPEHDVGASGTGGITQFLGNINFGFSNYGKALWDQGLPPVRNLPVSTPQYWTVMVLAAWQAEEGTPIPMWPDAPGDFDPNSEAMTIGLTLGISTHDDGKTKPKLYMGTQYTGMCTVLRAVVGEIDGREPHTVAHEVGHTLGLSHLDLGLMCKEGDCQLEPFTPASLDKLRKYKGP